MKSYTLYVAAPNRKASPTLLARSNKNARAGDRCDEKEDKRFIIIYFYHYIFIIIFFYFFLQIYYDV